MKNPKLNYRKQVQCRLWELIQKKLCPISFNTMCVDAKCEKSTDFFMAGIKFKVEDAKNQSYAAKKKEHEENN